MYGLTTLPTGITVDRLALLIAYSWMVSEKPGAFAEFGVCQGGSLDLLSRLHPDRLIYGIDSFEGLPEPGPEDLHKKGEFGLSEFEFKWLENYFMNRSYTQAVIFKGYSPKIFESIKDDETFAFVHVDVDLYSSVNDALDYFWPRLIETGIMIFDDYGFPTTPGAKKAIDEFKCDCTYRGELIFNNGHKSGQYIIIK